MTYACAAPNEVLPGRDRSARESGRRQLDPHTLERHIDRLYRAARFMCGSREEAEDLVQETFEHVLAKPRMLRSDDDLGYLLRVLRNTWVSRRRAAARRPQTVALLETSSLLEDRSAGRLDARLERMALYDAVAALPDIFRDVLVAIDVVGMSYRQAAGALGVHEGTVTTRLHRARQRVASQIGP
jgi:RNA polymerase sigma-70 factor, ECF subfamily